MSVCVRACVYIAASLRRMLGLKLKPDVTDCDGHSALWHALTAGSVDCARVLMKAGVPVPDVGDGICCWFVPQSVARGDVHFVGALL
jgi:hypothetical protein